MSDKIKIKVLQHCMAYVPGQELEVSSDEANKLCQIRERNDGSKVVKFRIAMPFDEYEKIRLAPVDKGGLTQDELEALGHKNIVPTPVDPTFEKRLEDIKNGRLGKEDAKPAKGKAGKKESSEDEDLAG